MTNVTDAISINHNWRNYANAALAPLQKKTPQSLPRRRGHNLARALQIRAELSTRIPYRRGTTTHTQFWSFIFEEKKNLEARQTATDFSPSPECVCEAESELESLFVNTRISNVNTARLIKGDECNRRYLHQPQLVERRNCRLCAPKRDTSSLRKRSDI